MSWKSVGREVARLKRSIPPPPTAADLADERFRNSLEASGDRDMVRVAQAVYIVLMENPRLTVEGLLNSDQGMKALEKTEGREPTGRLTPADVERFIQFWEASQS